MNRQNISKYLDQYAEPEIAIGRSVLAPTLGSSTWDQVIAVPVIAECESLPVLIQSMANAADKLHHRILLVLIINQREQVAGKVTLDNERTWQLVRSSFRPLRAGTDPKPWWLGESKGITVLAVDRFSVGNRFPDKQGVGLARKIGSDLALALIYAGAVRSPYIFNSDGDATLPVDFFDESDLDQAPLAMDSFYTRFEHVAPPNASEFEKEAIQLYDRYLHLYVDGLRLAQSPYAFHTVGSTIGYHANAYAAVRGFPRREAGEDFYLLNKLAKVGPIKERRTSPIVLEGRVSYRVPFGTGASVGKISELLAGGGTYQVYDPRSYKILQIWLKRAATFLDDGDLAALSTGLTADLDCFQIEGLAPVVLGYLEESQALSNLSSARLRAKGRSQIHRNFHDWFDAFRTLKFIHALRDLVLPPVAIYS